MNKTKTVKRLQLVRPFPNVDSDLYDIALADCPTCGRTDPVYLARVRGHEQAVSVARILGELVEDPGVGTW